MNNCLSRVSKCTQTMLNPKTAFTLAEVLITLAIIGVVAALTMPNLIAKYQKQETVTRLKKAYSALSQALRMSEVDNGPYNQWVVPEYSSDLDLSEYYEKYWYPYLNILKVCKTYSECGYSSNSPYSYSDGTKSTSTFTSHTERIPFITTDGILYSISVYSGTPTHRDSAIYFDLNGSKGPNRFGRDYFYVSITPQGNLSPGGVGMSADEILEECKSNGFNCLRKIMNDGWQIKDDYPW